MDRIYEYKCLCCGTVIEKKHKINVNLTVSYCPICKSSVHVEKLISKSTWIVS